MCVMEAISGHALHAFYQFAPKVLPDMYHELICCHSELWVYDKI